MNWQRIICWILKPVKQTIDPDCKYCRGMGYDSSGYQCTCVKEK